MGLAIAGSSIGGVVFPIALSRMLNNPKLGFGWSVRVCVPPHPGNPTSSMHCHQSPSPASQKPISSSLSISWSFNTPLSSFVRSCCSLECLRRSSSCQPMQS